MDAVILAVGHKKFTELSILDVDRFFGKGIKVFFDIKGVFERDEYEKAGYLYWRL